MNEGKQNDKNYNLVLVIIVYFVLKVHVRTDTEVKVFICTCSNTNWEVLSRLYAVVFCIRDIAGYSKSCFYQP